MNGLPTLRYPLGIILIFCLSLFILTFSCTTLEVHSFNKGYRKYKKGKIERAEKIFKKYEKHEVFDLGAEYYRTLIHYKKGRTLGEWAEADSMLAGLEARYALAGREKLAKLKKSNAGKSRVTNSRIRFQKQAIRLAERTGTIQMLDSVLTLFPNQVKKIKADWDSVRTHIVNRNLPTTDYDIATSILQHHQDVVWPINFKYVWKLQADIWELFKKKYPYTRMEHFRQGHPEHYLAADCWFDYAKAALANGSLDSLLSFRAHYPHSMFEVEILAGIFAYSEDEKVRDRLHAINKQQLEDLDLYQRLLSIVQLGTTDSTGLWRDLYHVLSKSAPRLSAVLLLELSTSYYLQSNQHRQGQTLLFNLQPLFPDTTVCGHSIGFKRNFGDYQDCAEQEPDSIKASLLDNLNAVGVQAYAAVSWGEGDERYFAQKQGKKTQVMRSAKISGQWSDPQPIPILSVSGATTPMSITADGLQMLLKIGGNLLVAKRPQEAANWEKPQQLSLKIPALGRAVFAPDGSAILFDATYPSKDIGQESNSNIYYSPRGLDGRFKRIISLGKTVNSDENESNPYLCADGKTLFFCSKGHGSVGDLDVFISRRNEDSNMWTIPENLGCQINGVGDDFGFTWVSENGQNAFFTKKNVLSKALSVWQTDLPLFARPAPISRLKGMIIDKKGYPIKSGTLVITIDHATTPFIMAVPPNGRFNLVVPQGTSHIKVLGEALGYLSLRDTTHEISALPGVILQDTFMLLSLKDISQNYQIRYATFNEGNAVLNDPRVYKELALLCAFAKGIKAQLDFASYTDNSGKAEDNLRLSNERAATIMRYMADSLRMPATKLLAEGRGMAEPRCSNSTPLGRRCNHRVEVKFKLPPASISKKEEIKGKLSAQNTSTIPGKKPPIFGTESKRVLGGPKAPIAEEEIVPTKRKTWWRRLLPWKSKAKPKAGSDTEE